jgi:hypothetical protein
MTQKKTDLQTQRVARAWVERENALGVDTAQPGVSATDKKSEAGASTSRRNLLGRSSKSTAALEGSDPSSRPSRKSTRKSSNRTKAATQKTRANTRKVTSPKARALRSQTRR